MLILIDEIMDYVRVAAASDPVGAVLDMAFLRVLLDVVNDVPNCVAVVVMIASDKDNMAMNREGEKHRAELEDLLTRNARTTAVTGGGDFAEIIQRRLFSTRPPVLATDATAERFLTGMRGACGFVRSRRRLRPGDAEAVVAQLLETDEGVASVDVLPGRGGAARRWVFETRKTLAMLTRAEKKTVSDADRDKAVTDRAFEIASSGPFGSIVKLDGGEVPASGATTEACIGVLEQAGIDDKHQARLVVLDSRWFSLFNGDDEATREATAAAMKMSRRTPPVDATDRP